MEILPKHLIEGLRSADLRAIRRRSRLRIHTGDKIWPVLRRGPDFLALDAAEITHLRGLVSLYDGSRQVSTLLIIASEIEGGELICMVKRETAVQDRAALDFARDENAPTALIPRF
ncbi:MAG TPA: hypothetical protein VGC31_01470 [Paenirhodobacter sp.]